MRRNPVFVIAMSALAAILILPVNTALADIMVRIDKRSQTMRVIVDGHLQYIWPVSTGRRGYGTPSGRFRPHRLEPRWYSRKYDMAPMHNAVFFHGGYAIHGTSHIRELGRPASHGCVRLHPAHSRELFDLVRSHGLRRTRISIH